VSPRTAGAQWQQHRTAAGERQAALSRGSWQKIKVRWEKGSGVDSAYISAGVRWMEKG
jgi:hypothetical protein